MRDYTPCTKDGYIGSWGGIHERIQDVKDCNCPICEDWLTHECPDALIDLEYQTTL